MTRFDDAVIRIILCALRRLAPEIRALRPLPTEGHEGTT